MHYVEAIAFFPASKVIIFDNAALIQKRQDKPSQICNIWV